MTERALPHVALLLRHKVAAFVTAGFVLATVVWPSHIAPAAEFVLLALITVAPIVLPGIFIAAWIIGSGADTRIAKIFEGQLLPTVFVASLIGAITPVCGVTVLPMMAGLLAAGVPLAPIMAFWLSSPVTDPAMIAITFATLGPSFAIGKTLAAFLLGLYGGMVTALFASRTWSATALRDTGIAKSLGAGRCGAERPFEPLVWRNDVSRQSFLEQLWATTRLMIVCLVPAFTAEYALNAALTPEALAPWLGADQWWSIPAAVFVGAPAYIDGYAALPLTRGLIDGGMAPGAAMAFLVSGGVISIWGAMAIAPVLKLKPFLLYLVLAISGSLASGYLFEWIV